MPSKSVTNKIRGSSFVAPQRLAELNYSVSYQILAKSEIGLVPSLYPLVTLCETMFNMDLSGWCQ